MNIIRTVAAIFIASAAIAGTISPESSDERHVEYGKKFRYVAMLLCSGDDGKSLRQGSCVLIGDRWALTAAHAVDGMDEWVIVTDDGKRHEIEGVAIHERYVAGDLEKGGDIAICKSRDSFGLEWYPPLYADRDEVGKVASIAGFGVCGTFERGRSPEYDGVRRAGSNLIDFTDGDCLVCTPSDSLRKTSLEFHIAPGDSGGGLFVGNRLAGINSRVSVSGTLPPKGVFGEESSHTRVSDYLDWIRKEMCRE